MGLASLGYHFISACLAITILKKLPWVDAYVNAAMILSGMGPVDVLKTEAGKIFAGTYALFSGILFLVVIAFIFAPAIHRFLHLFHIEESKFK